MENIIHTVVMRGRYVADLQRPCIVSRNQAVDYLLFEVDSTWQGYDRYAVVFHRGNIEDVEVTLDPLTMTARVPSSHIVDKGYLAFTLKATSGDEVRLVSASKGARLEVTPSGVVEGAEPTEEQITALEQALAKAEAAGAVIVEVTPITNGYHVDIIDGAGDASSFELFNGEKGEKGDKGAKGSKGDKGDSFTYDDFTPEQLLALKGEKGDKGDTGEAFTYDDFTREQLEALKGDKGDKGDTGEQGIKGDKGDKGDAFTYADFTPEQLEALKGDKGDKGDTGDTGAKGDKGDTGETGAKGDKGDKGDDFTYADFTPEQLAALKGEKGDKGDTGETGAKGDKGDTGAKGDKGDTGDDGVTPTVTITTITGGHTVSFDYGTGDSRNRSFDIMDGAQGAQGNPGTNGTDGDDGVTPTVTITTITGGHTVSFDYGTGDSRNRSVNIMDGADGDDYVLTATDKSDIATLVYNMLTNADTQSF